MWRDEPLSVATEKHRAWLRQAIAGIASPFVTAGEVTLPRGVTLRFADGASVTLRAHDQHCPEALVARCHPARFGDGAVTRVSRDVRDALQLDAAGGAFTVEGFDPDTSGVLATVRADLCPGDPNPLRAELYGVNVYRPGGHFLHHKDTPRGDDMLGTLVLCTSREFRGGDLVFTQGGAVHRVEFLRRGYGEHDRMRWAAFFGDVDHAVEEVTWGDRITLTWVLRRGDGAARAIDRHDSPTATLVAATRRAVADKDFAPDGATLGFACEHLYSETPGFVRALPDLTPKTVLRLKGRDQHVAAAMLEAGLAVRLRPYVIDEACEQFWELSRFPTAPELAVFHRHRFTESALDKALPIERGPDDVGVCWVVAPTVPSETRRRGGRRDAEASRFLGAGEYSEYGYFGNEGSDAAFYLHCALLVDVPAPGTRARTRLAADALRAAREAERGSAPAMAPRGATKKAVAKKSAVKKAAAKAPAKATTDAREYMTSELRALGYSAATIKQMLAEGTLQRTGYGWYRFTRPR